MARKIYKFKCDNPSCGKDVERNSREYKPKLDCKRFCTRQCLMDYNRDNKDIHNSKYNERRAKFEAKAALWLPIYQQYAHLGYAGLCPKLGGVTQRQAYDMRVRMVKKGYIVPPIHFEPNFEKANKERRKKVQELKQFERSKVKIPKEPKQPKQMVYREKTPAKVNRPQTHKQDAPKPMRVAPPIAGVNGYVRIRVGFGTRGYDVITNDPVGCREKHEKRIAQNDPLSKFRKTA